MKLQSSALTLLFLLPTAVASASQGRVEAVGEAMVKGGDTVAAKNAAVADALKKCIEQVVGIAIESEFTAEQQETVKNNQSEFYSSVRDALVQKSEGFIQSYEVLEESNDGKVFKAKVRAQVFESKIRAEAKKLADLISAAGNPKLMLAVQDVYISPDGSKQLASDSALGAYLEKQLIRRGFELRGGQAMKKIAGEDLQAFEGWLNDPAKVAETARQQGADIVIAGMVEISDKGPITQTAGLSALKGQTRIEVSSVIRAINVSTNEIFSTKPVQMSSIGASVERAAHRAFRGRGSNLLARTFDDLLVDIKESFQKTAERGQSYVVRLHGVQSFRNQGRRFMSALEKASGVAEVKQKSFADETLVVNVACKCTTPELQERIFSLADQIETLSTLDVEGVSGKQLSFRL